MNRMNSRAMFALIIAFISIFFLYNSQPFPDRSKIMPYTVSLVVLFLTITEIIIEVVPGFRKLELGKINYLNKNISAIQMKTATYHEQRSKICKNQLEFYKILAWIAISVFSIYFLGFLVALPIFVGLFYKFEVGFSWAKTILVLLIYVTIIFLFFQILLNVELYKGVFFK